jgi:RNA polymerase sigma-70 factor (ECF subfamily)
MLTAVDYRGLSEDALVMHARTGDREAFRAIMQRCNQRLFRIARAVLGNDDEAEDVLQEAYLKAFAAIAGFRGESGLFTWLSAITLNEARARLRRRRRTVDVTMIEDQPNVVAFPLTAAPAGPEDEAARAQMRRLLERAVDDLPVDFRLVFLLREVEGCSVEDTAQQLGLKPATVKTRHHRARRSLREALDKQLSGVVGDAFVFLGERCNAITEAVLARLDR